MYVVNTVYMCMLLNIYHTVLTESKQTIMTGLNCRWYKLDTLIEELIMMHGF